MTPALLAEVSPVFLFPAGIVIGLVAVIVVTAIRRSRNKR